MDRRHLVARPDRERVQQSWLGRQHRPLSLSTAALPVWIGTRAGFQCGTPSSARLATSLATSLSAGCCSAPGAPRSPIRRQNWVDPVGGNFVLHDCAGRHAWTNGTRPTSPAAPEISTTSLLDSTAALVAQIMLFIILRNKDQTQYRNSRLPDNFLLSNKEPRSGAENKARGVSRGASRTSKP